MNINKIYLFAFMLCCSTAPFWSAETKQTDMPIGFSLVGIGDSSDTTVVVLGNYSKVTKASPLIDSILDSEPETMTYDDKLIQAFKMPLTPADNSPEGFLSRRFSKSDVINLITWINLDGKPSLTMTLGLLDLANYLSIPNGSLGITFSHRVSDFIFSTEKINEDYLYICEDIYYGHIKHNFEKALLFRALVDHPEDTNFINAWNRYKNDKDFSINVTELKNLYPQILATIANEFDNIIVSNVKNAEDIVNHKNELSVLFRASENLNLVIEFDDSITDVPFNSFDVFSREDLIIRHFIFKGENIINVPHHFFYHLQSAETIEVYFPNVLSIGQKFLGNSPEAKSVKVYAPKLKSLDYGFVYNTPKLESLVMVATNLEKVGDMTHFQFSGSWYLNDMPKETVKQIILMTYCRNPIIYYVSTEEARADLLSDPALKYFRNRILVQKNH